MRKSSINIIIILLLFVASSSCNGTKKRWVVWFETYCDDPWFNEGNQNGAIKNYLEVEGVEVFNIQKKIGLIMPQSCSECDCRNGNVFRVRIKEEDTDKAIALGFYPD